MATFDPAPIWARVVRLARQAKPAVGTNPAVGAVIVRSRDGVIMAEGATGSPGTHHAEARAIHLLPKDEDPRGLEIFVGLEPCAHQGRTPPCTGAIIHAGITTVHAALRDLNPRVQGASEKALAGAGVRVLWDAPESIQIELFELNQAFHARMFLGRPWITAKWAMTLDGRIAARNGHARWVSGDESRLRVQELRRRVQAVAIGGNTARLDDPSLLVRDGDTSRQPLRVVFDRKGLTPPGHRLVSDPEATVFFGDGATPQSFIEAVKNHGKDWAEAPDLPGALAILARDHAIHEVLLEGGAGLFGAFFKEELVDAVEVFISPKILGDGSAYPVVTGGRVVSEMGHALGCGNGRFTASGVDMQFSAVLHPETLVSAWHKTRA